MDRALLEVLSSAAQRASVPHLAGRWNKLLTAVCQAIRLKWNSTAKLVSASDLAAFQSAREAAICDCPLPDLERTWDSLKDAFRDSVAGYSPGDTFDFGPFDDLTEVATELDRAELDFLAERGFPSDFENEIVAVIGAAHEAMADPHFSDDPEQLRECAKTLSQVSGALQRVSTLSAILSLDVYGKSKEFERGSTVFEERAVECEPPEPDDDGDSEHRVSSPDELFDVDALFSEL
jgi:hypothetical protein